MSPGPPDTVNAQTWPFVISLVGQLQGHLQKQWLARRARLIELFEAAIKGHAAAAVLFDVQGRVVAAHGTGILGAAPIWPRSRAGDGPARRRAARAASTRNGWRRWHRASDRSGCRRSAKTGTVSAPSCAFRRPPVGSMQICVRPRLGRHWPPAFLPLLCTSPSLEGLLRQAERFATAKTSLLLEGETGTGKDVLARAVHAAGPFHAGPFVPVNCAALPHDILASELFGHAEGAFTGARRGGAKGRFEQANGGVLFLDEIGDMPGGPAALPAPCPGGRHGLAPGRGGAAQDHDAGHRCHQPAARQRRSGRTLPC